MSTRSSGLKPRFPSRTACSWIITTCSRNVSSGRCLIRNTVVNPAIPALETESRYWFVDLRNEENIRNLIPWRLESAMSAAGSVPWPTTRSPSRITHSSQNARSSSAWFLHHSRSLSRRPVCCPKLCRSSGLRPTRLSVRFASVSLLNDRRTNATASQIGNRAPAGAAFTLRNKGCVTSVRIMVRGAGLEPARYFYHEPLKLACLPVPPPSHSKESDLISGCLKVCLPAPPGLASPGPQPWPAPSRAPALR